MAEWKHFPFQVNRLDEAKQFGAAERDELELLISEQTAALLGQYGMQTQVIVDNSEHIGVDGAQTFYNLEVVPFVLDDGSELYIQQVPILNGELDTSEGLHCIRRADEDDKTLLEFAVYDPSIETDLRILYADGQKVQIEVLQEIYEALTVCIFTTAIAGELNEFVHDTTSYPIAVVEPDVQSIVDTYLD